jgi:hypothetical protein
MNKIHPAAQVLARGTHVHTDRRHYINNFYLFRAEGGPKRLNPSNFDIVVSSPKYFPVCTRYMRKQKNNTELSFGTYFLLSHFPIQ